MHSLNKFSYIKLYTKQPAMLVLLKGYIPRTEEVAPLVKCWLYMHEELRSLAHM